MDKLLRIEEAARVLSISRAKAYSMAARNEMPGLIRLGGSVRVDPRVLAAWLDECAAKPTTDRVA